MSGLLSVHSMTSMNSLRILSNKPMPSSLVVTTVSAHRAYDAAQPIAWSTVGARDSRRRSSSRFGLPVPRVGGKLRDPRPHPQMEVAMTTTSKLGSASLRTVLFFMVCAFALTPDSAVAQEPESWGDELVFHTFSIAGVDRETGESGVAVTTRVACVGNGVPWVRAGVGAVATQASTRTAYGKELLDMLEQGMTPQEALDRATAADEGRENRQVGVVALDGTSAQHTGEGPGDWAGHRSGPNYATQGNVLVGPEVLAAVAAAFEASEGSYRHLADRLIEALSAGQAIGGDRRVGRLQSAAVIVVDPREGMARRADGQTVHINVCENPTPVEELRRIYDTVSGTLGYRELSQPVGNDVFQVKLIMHALGYYRSNQEELERGRGTQYFDDEVAAAVDSFRSDHGVANRNSGGSPPGFVDAQAVALMWSELEAAGKATELRRIIRDLTAVRR